MAAVPVPETAVYEDSRSIHWQHYVWFSWQILPVNSEPKAEQVKRGAEIDFRFDVLGFDPAHHF